MPELKRTDHQLDSVSAEQLRPVPAEERNWRAERRKTLDSQRPAEDRLLALEAENEVLQRELLALREENRQIQERAAAEIAEGARALHRVELERQQLRQELRVARLLLDDVLGEAPHTGDGPEAPSEPPAYSKQRPRQTADTARPTAKRRGSA